MGFEIGMVKTYIKDYPGFRPLVEIPAEAAIAWVKRICPEHCIGSSIKMKDATMDNLWQCWNNKYWIIVAAEKDQWIAIQNCDGAFWLYTKKVENKDFSSET